MSSESIVESELERRFLEASDLVELSGTVFEILSPCSMAAHMNTELTKESKHGVKVGKEQACQSIAVQKALFCLQHKLCNTVDKLRTGNEYT